MRLPAASAITVIALFVLGLVTACGSGSTSNLKPEQMVLRLHDLPTGFQSAGHQYVSATAAAKSAAVGAAPYGRASGPPQYQAWAAHYKAWGYVIGYGAAFSRIASMAGLGSLDGLFSGGAPTEITSSVSVYRTSAGAEKSLAAGVKSCSWPSYNDFSPGVRIGNEAHLCAAVQKGGGVTAQSYAVMWRDGRIKAIIALIGLKGSVSPKRAITLATKQLVALARLQDARIRSHL